MAVSFAKYQDEIIKAWRDVTDSTGAEKWALFGYEGNTNNIKLMSTGSNGLDELVKEFNCSLIQYAFCRVIDKELGVNKLILINWQGDSSPLSRKGLCASHVGDVTNYFKGCTLTITIRSDDEATKEYLMEQVMKTSSTRIKIKPQSTLTPSTDTGATTSSSYTKADSRSEISVDRKSFWQRQEEEEKERLLEEKKRTAERQASFERERKLKEEIQAKKLAEAIKERDQLIEATRRADQRSSSQVNNNSNQSNNVNDDDGRVGRRSELLRLERNQETQSLISKGSIKSKRAIFEQAQQDQQNNPQPTLSRRTSGAMIVQRLSNFQSFDNSTNPVSNSRSGTSIEKLSNGFAKQVNVEERESASTLKEEDKEKVEETQPVKDVNNEGDNKLVNSEVSINKIQEPIVAESTKAETVANDITSDLNGNEEITKADLDSNDPIIANGSLGIRAKALYDYQAADNTEISFDPDDIIGQIQKVDPGWWHGTVVTGNYKDQKGLFPANYVQELK